MRQGDTITLEPKTRHGKNRVNEHGADWIVMNTGRFKGQPAVHLRSVDKTFKMGQAWTFDGRWFLINNDPDFDIIAN
jgi:hypothetical protein